MRNTSSQACWSALLLAMLQTRPQPVIPLALSQDAHFPKTIFLILCLVLCNTVSKAQHAPFEVTLWPSTPPGNSGLTGPETIDEHGFVHNVTLPSLLVYPAAQEKNTGMAVLIAPGGGYSFLAINHEGKEIAQWLAGNGITGVVLKYRIPNVLYFEWFVGWNLCHSR